MLKGGVGFPFGFALRGGRYRVKHGMTNKEEQGHCIVNVRTDVIKGQAFSNALKAQSAVCVTYCALCA
ncbi:MAG: hypothetical protein ACRCSB_05555 [Bacteroidales bacterium]